MARIYINVDRPRRQEAADWLAGLQAVNAATLQGAWKAGQSAQFPDAAPSRVGLGDREVVV